MIDDDLHSGDKTGQWRDFLKQKCRKQLAEIGREYPHKRSLYIDYKSVEMWGKEGITLADEIPENPGKVMEDIRDAVFDNNLIRTPDNKPLKKDAINIRLVGLRKKTAIRDLRHDDVNRLVSIDAIVMRVTEVRPRIIEAVFRCPAGHFTVKPQAYGRFVEPDGCATDGCTFKKLELIPRRSKFTNQQKIKIQESPEGLHAGQQPQTFDAVILDDICDMIFSGDRATFNGIIRSVQRIVKGEKSTVFDLYLEVSSIEVEKRDFDEIDIPEESIIKIKEIAESENPLEMVAASIAPSIYGYTDMMRGIALHMFGGVSSQNSDETDNRGDIHMLIMGDPGCAKTKVIQYVAKQSPRGVFVSCATSTSAVGLTGMAVRDEDGRWSVEAGALPLADKGTCAADEIDKAKPEIIDALLTAMETQEVRIVKAGQNRAMKSRCSMIFAGNPKHERFDMFGEELVDQIDLPPAFMSRLDLVYLMIDNPEQKMDEARSRHVIKNRYIAECRAAGKMDRVSEEDIKSVEPPIPPSLLRQYIAYAKRNIIPIMNPQVREYLTAHYVKIRGASRTDSVSPPTMRQQEALIRLAEAAAKIRLSQTVTLKDAEVAVSIFDQCMKAIATDPKTGKVDLGRIGQGVSQEKINMIGAMREIIKDNPKCSKALLLAKMAERSYTKENAIINALERGMKDGDISDPGMNEHYRWEGK